MSVRSLHVTMDEELWDQLNEIIAYYGEKSGFPPKKAALVKKLIREEHTHVSNLQQLPDAPRDF